MSDEILEQSSLKQNAFYIAHSVLDLKMSPIIRHGNEILKPFWVMFLSLYPERIRWYGQKDKAGLSLSSLKFL